MGALGASRPSNTTVWLRTVIVQRISRRHLRVGLICVFLALGSVVYLSVLCSRSPKTWTIETLVHDHDITKHGRPQTTLPPFPESPLQPPHQLEAQEDSKQRPWLTAVMCAAHDVERRMLIRSTWMRLYRDVPFVPRFVVSNPGLEWKETVQYENRTFGDIIVLDHLEEDDVTANTIKTLEFYKWLLHGRQRYEYVTKLDTDLWLNAAGFWNRYLVPRLSNSTGRYAATVERTVIGQLYFSDSGYNTFAHGSMYTMTWDMIQLLVRLQERFDVVTGEDATVGILMHQAGERADFVNLGGEEKFDYDDADSRGDGTAYARAGSHPQAQSHALYGQDAIAVHQLKDKKLWMKVARCFTERGIRPAPMMRQPEPTPPLRVRWNDLLNRWGLSKAYRPMFDAIPKEMLHFEKGNLICDNIWNLGKSTSRSLTGQGVVDV